MAHHVKQLSDYIQQLFLKLGLYILFNNYFQK